MIERFDEFEYENMAPEAGGEWVRYDDHVSAVNSKVDECVGLLADDKDRGRFWNTFDRLAQAMLALKEKE
jgi:hypothetical protein